MSDKPISLRDVVGELSMLPEEAHVYLDKVTGTFIGITDSQFAAAESGEPLDAHPDWERDILAAAREVETTGRYVALPDSSQINEYNIMERYCYSLDDLGLRDELLRAISGRGAFRMFRDVVRRHGLLETWYVYRDEALTEIARSWLQDNGISFIDDMVSDGTKDT